MVKACVNCDYTLDDDSEICPSCGFVQEGDDDNKNLCDDCATRADCSIKADYKQVIACAGYSKDDTVN